MECRKYQEHITAAVDNALEKTERDALELHLADCPSCRNEFEVEKLTRNLVRMRCQRKRAPGYVLQQISQRLEREDQPTQQVSWWKTLVGSTYFKPAVAFATACVAIIFLVNNPSLNSPRVIEASLLPQNDIIKQSLANHVAVVAGEITPQVVSNQAEYIQGFFAGKTKFPVVLPKMTDCTLVGGVLNDFGGEALAHVVYSYNSSEIIYVYEACWKTVLNGSPFHLSRDVVDELQRTQRYSTTTPDGRSLVLWTDGRTLCAAVSRIEVAALIACLDAAR